jgi:hypothetical protein
MPITLTTAFTVPNGTRLVFGKFDFNDDTSTMTVPMELKTPPATDATVARYVLTITNGTCSLLTRQASPTVGLGLDDPTRWITHSTRTVATGYTDAITAFRGAANNANARRTAMEAHMLSAGHIDSTLTGT